MIGHVLDNKDITSPNRALDFGFILAIGKADKFGIYFKIVLESPRNRFGLDFRFDKHRLSMNDLPQQIPHPSSRILH